MIDLSNEVEALVSSSPIRLTPVKQLVSGVRRRKKRRLMIGAVAATLVCGLAGWIFLDATQLSPVEIAVGSDASIQLAEGFIWFEGDGFAVQIPEDWNYQRLSEINRGQLNWSAWSISQTNQPEIRVTVTEFSYDSFGRWLNSGDPVWRGGGHNPENGETITLLAEVAGAPEAVRVEKETLDSKTTREDTDEVIEIEMRRNWAIAAWRPDGHVMSLIVTIHQDSAISDEAIETILGSFTLRPVS